MIINFQEIGVEIMVNLYLPHKLEKTYNEIKYHTKTDLGILKDMLKFDF